MGPLPPLSLLHSWHLQEERLSGQDPERTADVEANNHVLINRTTWKMDDLHREEDEENEEEYKKLTEFRVVPLPTFSHAHIENRRKTLVYINSVRALQQQFVPPPPLASQNHYPKACDSIGNSTGLYLYAHKHTPLLPPPLKEDTQNQDPHATTALTDGIEDIDDEDAWECVSCMLGHVFFWLVLFLFYF
jgi:hypothetical protein